MITQAQCSLKIHWAKINIAKGEMGKFIIIVGGFACFSW